MPFRPAYSFDTGVDPRSRIRAPLTNCPLVGTDEDDRASEVPNPSPERKTRPATTFPAQCPSEFVSSAARTFACIVRADSRLRPLSPRAAETGSADFPLLH